MSGADVEDDSSPRTKVYSKSFQFAVAKNNTIKLWKRHFGASDTAMTREKIFRASNMAFETDKNNIQYENRVAFSLLYTERKKEDD